MAPENIQRIDHVAFLYHRANHHRAVENFTKAFGITDWDGPTEQPLFGLLVTQSIKAGIEVLAPLTDSSDNVFAEHLRAKGEGFYALAFGVADLGAAAERAEKAGMGFLKDKGGEKVVIDGLRMNKGAPIHAAWEERLKRYDEHQFERLNGGNFLLSQIEFKD